MESSALQPFCTNPESASIEVQYFDPVPPPIAENEQVTTERILLESSADQRIQSIVTFALMRSLPLCGLPATHAVSVGAFVRFYFA